MLKRPITYTTYDGDEITEDFYFNVSKADLIEMELSEVDGLKTTIEKIIAAKDIRSLINEFKKIVLGSYGEKSEDGKRFIKSEEFSKNFSQSAAYDVLFVELTTDDVAATTFIKGILPPDMVGELDKAIPQDKPKEAPKPFKLPPMPPTVE